MTRIDPGLNFFGHLVTADMTLEDLGQFLTVVDEFLRKTANRLAGKRDQFGDDRSDAFVETSRKFSTRRS